MHANAPLSSVALLEKSGGPFSMICPRNRLGRERVVFNLQCAVSAGWKVRGTISTLVKSLTHLEILRSQHGLGRWWSPVFWTPRLLIDANCLLPTHFQFHMVSSPNMLNCANTGEPRHSVACSQCRQSTLTCAFSWPPHWNSWKSLVRALGSSPGFGFDTQAGGCMIIPYILLARISLYLCRIIAQVMLANPGRISKAELVPGPCNLTLEKHRPELIRHECHPDAGCLPRHVKETTPCSKSIDTFSAQWLWQKSLWKHVKAPSATAKSFVLHGLAMAAMICLWLVSNMKRFLDPMTQYALQSAIPTRQCTLCKYHSCRTYRTCMWICTRTLPRIPLPLENEVGLAQKQTTQTTPVFSLASATAVAYWISSGPADIPTGTAVCWRRHSLDDSFSRTFWNLVHNFIWNLLLLKTSHREPSLNSTSCNFGTFGWNCHWTLSWIFGRNMPKPFPRT